MEAPTLFVVYVLLLFQTGNSQTLFTCPTAYPNTGPYCAGDIRCEMTQSVATCTGSMRRAKHPCYWKKQIATMPNGLLIDTQSMVFVKTAAYTAADQLETAHNALPSRPTLYRVDDCNNIYGFKHREVDLDTIVSATSLFSAPKTLPRTTAYERGSGFAAEKVGLDGSKLSAPYNAVGLLVTHDGNGNGYSCSATLISPRHFLTAAHCVLDRTKATRDHYRFFSPSRSRLFMQINQAFASDDSAWDILESAGKPYYSVVAYTISVSYLLTAGDASVPYDWAIGELSQSIQQRTQHVHYLGFGYDNNLAVGTVMASAGYPGIRGCCNLWKKPIYVTARDGNSFTDTKSPGFQGQSGSSVFDDNYKIRGVLVAIHKSKLTKSIRINKARYFIFCDLLQEYASLCAGTTPLLNAVNILLRNVRYRPMTMPRLPSDAAKVAEREYQEYDAEYAAAEYEDYDAEDVYGAEPPVRVMYPEYEDNKYGPILMSTLLLMTCFCFVLCGMAGCILGCTAKLYGVALKVDIGNESV